MAKTTHQNDRGRHATGAETPPGLDPTNLVATFEPFFEAGSKLLENWRVVSSEILEFGKTRLSRNLEATQRVARSSTLDQAIEAQADFARSMMQDYIAEAGKLADLSTRAIFGSLSTLQAERRQMRRGVEGVAASSERTSERMAAE